MGRGPAAPPGRGMLLAAPEPPGRGALGRPMPWLLAKGLLPGRGAPGRGPPGFGPAAPGLASSVAGAEAASAAAAARCASAWAWRSATVSGATGAGMASPSASTAGAGAVSTTGCSATGGFGAGAGAAGRGPPGFGALLPEVERAGVVAAGAAGAVVDAGAAAPANAWRSFRTTGGSMLEDGPLTNSPISFSFSSAVLLSIPSSLAISCTRGLATVLLSRAPSRSGRSRQFWTGLISSRSLVVHVPVSLFCRGQWSWWNSGWVVLCLRRAPRGGRAAPVDRGRSPGGTHVGKPCASRPTRTPPVKA